MTNPPKAPGYYWLLSSVGPRNSRHHTAQPVHVYDNGLGHLVYTRCGYYRDRPVTEAPDGVPGWRWGNKIESPL